jgi:hypothetical protein
VLYGNEESMFGEPTYRKVLHGDDIGTRLSHMMELQDLWSTAYGVLTRPYIWHSPLEELRAKEIEMALDLLQHHMEAEYNLTQYAKEINEVSKPKKDDPPDTVTFSDTV